MKTHKKKMTLRVLETPAQPEPINYPEIYRRVFNEKLIQAVKAMNLGTLSLDQRKQLIYLGVKIVLIPCKCFRQQQIPEKEKLENIFITMEVIESLIAEITPRDLTTIFPIEKRYDGDKYEIKDYFSTMEKLNKIGMDNPITEKNVFSLLFDYQNQYLCDYACEKMCVASGLRKHQGLPGIMEVFMEQHNLKGYKMMTDADGKKFLYDPEEQTTYKVSKPRPRYLRVIK